jgi:hypothetical protein
VLVGVVGIGVLTSTCYDYLDVTVYDAEGRKTCDATVTATSATGNTVELTSCYSTPLGDGVWSLRAHLQGYPGATSEVRVDNRNECVHHVQRVELTLTRMGEKTQPATPIVSAPIPIAPALDAGADAAAP